MSTKEDKIAAIRTLIGRIEVAEATANPSVFDQRIWGAVQAILEHYGKQLVVSSVHYENGRFDARIGFQNAVTEAASQAA
jgi:hypothetical protein